MSQHGERLVIGLLGCLVGGLLLLGGRPQRGGTDPFTDHPRRFLVAGEGVVPVRPDVFKASITIEATADTAAAAQAGSRATMTRVLEKLTAFGVQERDLQTGRYVLRQRRIGEYDRARPAVSSVTSWPVTGSK